MAISKNSTRVQFTLNTDKPKEKKIKEFLDECFNPNSAIKEIIFNYIVTHCDTKLPQVTQTEDTQSDKQLPKVSNCDNHIESNSDYKLVEVSNREEKLLEGSKDVSELELNEMEELKKFI